MKVLPTSRADCPVCASAEATPYLANAPAQLVDLDQTFDFVRCAECALVYLRDRVDLGAMDALYDADYPLHRGPKLWGPFAPLVERDQRAVDEARVRAVLERRPLGPSDTVLDVGCGRPTFLATIAGRTGCRALGVDLATVPDEPRFRGVDVHRGMPPAWPAEVDAAAPFAATTLWHYLEHDPEPVETLRWLASRTRPDGVAVVEVPDLDGTTARVLGRWWPGLHTPRHASVFTKETLARAAERGGWEVVSIERRGTLAPFVLVALGALDRVGFRFGRHPAPLVFPLWAAGLGLTWPALGRASREGMGLLTAVLRPR